MNDFEARSGIATRKIQERLGQSKQEAARIASWTANTFYPQQEFIPLDTLSGILSQIDNMLIGINKRPSLSDAVKEVERLYDEWWDVDRRRWLNVVLERLKSLEVREASTPTGEQS